VPPEALIWAEYGTFTWPFGSELVVMTSGLVGATKRSENDRETEDSNVSETKTEKLRTVGLVILAVRRPLLDTLSPGTGWDKNQK
jgi:hypothetical protein